jgi:hypothetical protein
VPATRSQEAPPKRGQSGFDTKSLVSFPPPLKKRAKRWQKMGAHLTASEQHGSSVVLKIVLALLYLIMVPLLIMAGGLMLVVIVMLVGLNMLLAIWQGVIHWVFAENWSKNIHALVGFVEQVIAIFSRSR